MIWQVLYTILALFISSVIFYMVYIGTDILGLAILCTAFTFILYVPLFGDGSSSMG